MTRGTAGYAPVPPNYISLLPLQCVWLMLIPELDRDLFSLPDGEKPTLLFVTSGTPPPNHHHLIVLINSHRPHQRL
jgi:hypothetical protein